MGLLPLSAVLYVATNVPPDGGVGAAPTPITTFRELTPLIITAITSSFKLIYLSKYST